MFTAFIYSFPKRDTDQQGNLVHNKPVQDPSFPLLEIHPRCIGEPESPKYPAEQHSHLHQRQILPRTNRRSVREGEERSRVVLSRGRTSAEPSFWKECIWRVEVPRVTVNAVCVKNELRLFRNDPAPHEWGLLH